MLITRDDGDGPSRKLTKVDGLIHFALSPWFVVGVGRLDGNGTGSPAGAAARFAGLSATPVALGPWARTSAWVNSGLLLTASVRPGVGPHVDDRRGVRDDGAIGCNELDYEFGDSTRGIGQNELQIAEFIGFQVPFAFAIGASRGQPAALWQSAYGDNAPGGHSISTVERNRQADLLAGCSFQQGGRREDRGRTCKPGRWLLAFVRRKHRGPRPRRVDHAQPEKASENQVW